MKVVDINPKMAQAIQKIKDIRDGCIAVRNLDESPKQTKDLATYVIRDCNWAIAILEGKRFPSVD